MANKQKLYNAETEAFANGAAEDAVYSGSSPEDQVVNVDSSNYLLQQVLSLPYSESQAIFLHYYKNLKIDDIAYLLETSRSTVKRYIASGKKRLEQSLV